MILGGDQLPSVLSPEIWRGLQQVAVAGILALIIVIFSRIRNLNLERELGVALVRGFVQVVAMGSVVGLLLTVSLGWSGLILLFMIGGATWISRRRGKGLPSVTRISFVAIAFGAGTTIVVMTLAGAIEATVRNLVPVGSMVIANSMKINSLCLDRFIGELRDNRARIESGLALGAPPSAVVAPHLETGVRAALIPTVDSLRSLGWVWIPGVMTGMILADANPIYAALYQFVIVAMIFGAGGLTSLTSSFLIGSTVFTEAEQLRDLGPSDEENATE